jgi:hypothetical protein
MDLEVEVRPPIEEQLPEVALVELHEEPARRVGRRAPHQVVEDQIRVPSLDQESSDPVSCVRVDHAADDPKRHGSTIRP